MSYQVLCDSCGKIVPEEAVVQWSVNARSGNTVQHFHPYCVPNVDYYDYRYVTHQERTADL